MVSLQEINAGYESEHNAKMWHATSNTEFNKFKK